ncbi:amidohydrolase family protein [Ensifer sp. M14]|uniref:metal-dependent hydrolase family protein n=1 Tax=Ensifer sp. M14 TaxID=2203782 RepID=UPI000E1DA3BF|nr:amidohydrolase family protein [Ensifer sp. M14]
MKATFVARALSHAVAAYACVRTAFKVPLSSRRWLAALFVLGACPAAWADDVLFEDVRIFDGKGATSLSAPSNVLVKGNVIARISTDPVEAEGAQRIAGNGRTLMPGLIDAHWHAMLARSTPAESFGDVGFNNLVAGDEATDTLMRGFTTVRDVGGPVFGLKRAIDTGIVEGPRIYPSGAMITVTSGHGDFRQMSDLPRVIGGPFARMEQVGGSIVVDSPDEVRLRAREQFMQGAALIKVTAGGGVSSPHSPLDVTTFTEPELRAAVEIADNWGTYVAAHAFTSHAIRIAIAAGVKCIEHGFLMDEETAKLIAEKGIWLSLQPLPELLRQGFAEGSVERAKADEVWPGIGRTYELAKKYKIKTAWGTDVLFSRALAQQQGAILASLKRWYTPAEALSMATGTNAQLLALSGPRNPYPGKLGVVEEGALADLLLVDGNPLENIDLVADAANNFKIIMKDGIIYKNTLGK